MSISVLEHGFSCTYKGNTRKAEIIASGNGYDVKIGCGSTEYILPANNPGFVKINQQNIDGTITERTISIASMVPTEVQTLRDASAFLYDNSIRDEVLGTAANIDNQALTTAKDVLFMDNIIHLPSSEIATNNSLLKFKFTSPNDWRYICQVQHTHNLSDWTDVNEASFYGDGLSHEISYPMNESKGFFRVAIRYTDVTPEERAQTIQGFQDPNIPSHWNYFTFLRGALYDDKDVILAAINFIGTGYTVLSYTSERLKNDKDVVLAAVKKDCDSLQFASERLRDAKDVVLASVANSGQTLQFASERLRDDKDVVLAAVNNDSSALLYASNRLKTEKIYQQYAQLTTIEEKFNLLNSLYISSGRTLSDLSKFDTSIGSIPVNYGIDQPHPNSPLCITVNGIKGTENIKEAIINGNKFLRITGYYSSHNSDYYRGVYLVNAIDGTAISCSNAGGVVKKVGNRFVVSAQFDSSWWPSDSWGPKYIDIFTKENMSISKPDWDALPLYSGG